jgi:hypothetical protein
MFYSGSGQTATPVLARLAFLPQLALVVRHPSRPCTDPCCELTGGGTQSVIGVVWFRDLPAALLLQTLAFVAFNKVCTVQYFVWYLSLLPLVAPFLLRPYRRLVTLAVVWLASLGIWLGTAYMLEFGGQPVFGVVWVASLLYAAGSTVVLVRLAQLCQHTSVQELVS